MKKGCSMTAPCVMFEQFCCYGLNTTVPPEWLMIKLYIKSEYVVVNQILLL